MHSERHFEDTINRITEVGNNVLNEHLKEAKKWNENERWLKLHECVSKWLPLDSSDNRSVKILAILWDCTEKEVEKKLHKYGC